MKQTVDRRQNACRYDSLERRNAKRRYGAFVLDDELVFRKFIGDITWVKIEIEFDELVRFKRGWIGRTTGEPISQKRLDVAFVRKLGEIRALRAHDAANF